MIYQAVCYTLIKEDPIEKERGVGMNQNQRIPNHNKSENQLNSSQKYFINRMKYRFIIIFPVFGFLFGCGTLKSYEAEPMIFILFLCVVGSLAEFIPPGWEKASSEEDKKTIDWNGFIKALVRYGIMFVIGLVIGFVFRAK